VAARAYQHVDGSWIDLYEVRQAKPKKAVSPAKAAALAAARRRRQFWTCRECGSDRSRNERLYSWDEIIEVAVLDRGGAVLLEHLVNPTQPIDPDAERVHGLTAAALADAPRFPAIAGELAQLLEDRPVVVYNAEFDAGMLAQSFARYSRSGKDGRSFRSYWNEIEFRSVTSERDRPSFQ
jgi:DNA polymerase III epsilon subunit-like protein